MITSTPEGNSATDSGTGGIWSPVEPSHRDIDLLLEQIPWVRSLALQLCGDPHRAEDAAQEVWVAAAHRPLRDPARLRSYLARIVRNLLSGDARRARRRQRREQIATDSQAATAKDTADLVMRAEMLEQVVHAVLGLPEVHREVILLHHFDGLAVTAIAARTGRSPDAVRALLRRARERLRETLRRLDPRFAFVFGPLSLPVAANLSVWSSLGVFVMSSKAVSAIVAACVLAIAIPFLGRGAPSNASAPKVTRSGVEPARAEAPPQDPKEPPSPRVAVAPTLLTIEGRLLGSDLRLPWTTTLALDARWTEGGTAFSHQTSAEIGADGRFRFALPRGSAQSSSLRVHVTANDSWYEALDTWCEVAGVNAPSIEVRVAPAPVLIGTLVDHLGLPGRAMRIVVFAASAGVPRAGRVAETVTDDSGAWRLRLRAAGEFLVVGLPPAERDDLIPVSAAIDVRGFTTLDSLVLPPVSLVTGTLRWSDGTPVTEATLDWRIRSEVAFDPELGLNWQAGQIVQSCRATVDARGHFAIRTRAGQKGTVMLDTAARCQPAGFTMVPAVAPQDVEMVVAGHPVTIRVLRDGLPAGRTGVQWRRERFAGNYGTDEAGLVRQLVLDEPIRMRAVSRDQTLASDWVEFQGRVPDEVVLQLLPLDGDPVVIRLDGAALPSATFAWNSETDPAASRTLTLAAVDGTFAMPVLAGRYRLRILGMMGSASEYLLPAEHEVTLPHLGDLTLPVRLGGRMHLVVTDDHGAFLRGRYRLLRDGLAVSAPQVAREGQDAPTTMNLAPGRESFSAVFEAGSYELVLELDGLGETRRNVEIGAGRTAEVRVVVR